MGELAVVRIPRGLICNTGIVCRLCAVCVLIGCGSGGQTDTTGPTFRSMGPVSIGRLGGLEARLWTVDASDHAVARAISAVVGGGEFSQVLSEDDQVLARAVGIRIVAIERSRLAEVREALRLRGAIVDLWLGQAPNWVSLVTSEPLEQPYWVDTGSVSLPLSAGRLSLDVRAWTGPGRGVVGGSESGSDEGGVGGPVLRIVLEPTHMPVHDLDGGRGLPGMSGDVSGRVQRLDSLRMSFEGDGGHVYVVFYESEDVDLGDLPDVVGAKDLLPLHEREGPELGGDGATEDVEESSQVEARVDGDIGDGADLQSGPESNGDPMIGRLLLMVRGDDEVGRVLVLVPRLPERFELVPSRR